MNVALSLRSLHCLRSPHRTAFCGAKIDAHSMEPVLYCVLLIQQLEDSPHYLAQKKMVEGEVLGLRVHHHFFP